MDNSNDLNVEPLFPGQRETSTRGSSMRVNMNMTTLTLEMRALSGDDLLSKCLQAF